MNITYDYYRIFYFVAKYRSFSQAAELLMSNEPNISRTVKNLEHELGVSLFIRTNRGVTLTPEGERLYTHVAAAHHQLSAAEEELADSKSLTSGTITLGVSETALQIYLLPILSAYHRKFPDIKIQIASVTTPQSVAALRSGLVDLAIVTSPTGVTRPLREIPLAPLTEILIGGPGFRHLSGQPVSLKELSSQPFILLNGQTNAHSFHLNYFRENGITLRPAIQVATTDQVLPMVRYDLGIGFMPAELAMDALLKEEVFEIRPEIPLPGRSICLIKNPSQPSGIAARELEKMLRGSSQMR